MVKRCASRTNSLLLLLLLLLLLAQLLLTLLNFLLTQIGRIPLLQQLLPPVHAVSATTVLPVRPLSRCSNKVL